jgi:hypothetical protein
VHADGTAGNGYVAYAFDESNIIRDNEGRGKPKFNIVQRANSDLPALVTVNWQDEDNQYVVDSLTVADLPALQRVSQNTTAAPPAEGFANYDQVRRIVNTWFAENAWGNPRNDPGGTFQIQITTTFKGVKLQIGQIVMLSWKQAGISQQLFRILQLKPSTDFETVDLLLQWHEDAWYTNAYGQATTPGGNGSGSMLPMRPPYPIMIGDCGDAINPLHPGANSRLALYSSTDGIAGADLRHSRSVAGQYLLAKHAASLRAGAGYDVAYWRVDGGRPDGLVRVRGGGRERRGHALEQLRILLHPGRNKH